MVELIFCIAFIIFLTGIVVVNGDFMRRIAVRATVDELHTTCHYMRMKALVNGVQQDMLCVPGDNAYYFDGRINILPDSVQYGTISGALGPPSSPRSVIDRPVTFINNVIEFRPTGIISSGALYLIDKSGKHGYALTSSIGSYSYMRRYVYDGTWHLIT